MSGDEIELWIGVACIPLLILYYLFVFPRRPKP